MNLFLFFFCTLVWGSTWFVVGFQVHNADPVVSVFYRFLISTLCLFSYCYLKKSPLRFGWAYHKSFIFQGVFLFSLNYILSYVAKTLISSGLVALCFTTLIYFNILGSRIFLGRKIAPQVLLGASLGGIGLALIFNYEFLTLQVNSSTFLGIFIALASTVCSSIGNLIAFAHQERKIEIASQNAWSMLYGCLFTALLILNLNPHFSLPSNFSYWGSLIYLSIFATVLTFGAYIRLIKEIGPDKAAYCNVLAPIVSLFFSWTFENFQWSQTIVIGVAFCLLGNIFTLWKKAPPSVKSRM